MRLASVVTLLILALFGAGCGQAKEEKFKDGFKPLNGKIVALGGEVGTAVSRASASSDKSIARQFGGYAQRVGDIRKDLDDLDPPDDLKKDKESLVQALGDAAAALRGIERAANTGSKEAARRATLQLVPASEHIRRARLRLARKTGVR
jgi:hypothetical protein